jgi:hypothetical protein
MLSPDWCSDGVSPSHALSAFAFSKALPVSAELEMERKRRQRVDAPEAPQPCDGRPPLLIGASWRDLPLSDRRLRAVRAVDGRDQVGEHQLARGSSNCWRASQRRWLAVQVEGSGYTRP